MGKRMRILRISMMVIVPLVMIALVPEADSQAQIGGVSIDGTWYVGEGLAIGDYFSYDMCHVNYKECKKFKMDFWIEGERQIDNETKWIASTVVYDGNKIIKGTIELGKVTPEPTGGSAELLKYRSAFKSSIVWLSAFATSYEGSGGDGPKKFNAPSWGKIANIGGEQILPTEIKNITVQGGTFDDAVSITWRTGGARSVVWIVDEFPFPIRASTWVHVSEGIPPQEYKFELLEYGNSKTDPFVNVVATFVDASTASCQPDDDFVKIKRSTRNGSYLVNFQYSPEMPVAGCDMTLLLNFNNKYAETKFLNQVQYDVVVTNMRDEILHRVSDAEGVRTLYSGSGQTRNDAMWVPSQPGDYVYVVIVNGLAPINTVPQTVADTLHVPITVVANSQLAVPAIPSWIKQTSGFWVDGHSSDAAFVSAIEFLISKNVIVVDRIDSPANSADLRIPSWIKQTTGFWVDGHSSDAEFVSAIEFLISRGVIVVS